MNLQRLRRTDEVVAEIIQCGEPSVSAYSAELSSRSRALRAFGASPVSRRAEPHQHCVSLQSSPSPDQGRTTTGVVRGLLERIRQLQDAPLIAVTTDNLQSDRQSAVGKTARN